MFSEYAVDGRESRLRRPDAVTLGRYSRCMAEDDSSEAPEVETTPSTGDDVPEPDSIPELDTGIEWRGGQQYDTKTRG